MNWKEQQEAVDKEQEAIANSIPFAKQRYEICKKCELYSPALRVCNTCHCFMPVKVRLKNAYCPVGKWSRIEG